MEHELTISAKWVVNDETEGLTSLQEHMGWSPTIHIQSLHKDYSLQAFHVCRAMMEILEDEIFAVSKEVVSPPSQITFGIERFSPEELTFSRFVALAGKAVFHACFTINDNTNNKGGSNEVVVSRVELEERKDESCAVLRVWTIPSSPTFTHG